MTFSIPRAAVLVLRSILLMLVMIFMVPPAMAQEAILSIKSTHQVRPDGAVESIEEIKLRAESNVFVHGLDVRLPLSLQSPFGGKVRRKISDIAVTLDGAPDIFSVSEFGGTMRIRSGGERDLQPGEYVFQVSYLSRGQLKFRDGEDELIVPVVPYDWSVPVQDASVEIFLPSGKIASRLFASTGEVDSRTGSIIINKKAGDSVKVQTSRSLPSKNGMTVAVTWPAGGVARPTLIGRLQEFIDEYRHLGIWLFGGGGLFIMSLFIRWRSKNRARAIEKSNDHIVPRDISPATVQYLHEGRISYGTIAAQILGLATKGYLTIEETEVHEFLLQRTWRESDLGLTPCDYAVSRAFYENRPTRFLITPQSAPPINGARQNLGTAIADEVERANWRGHPVFSALFWLFAFGIAVTAIVLSPARLWVILGPVFMFGGAFAIYRSLMRKDIAWHGLYENRGAFSLLLQASSDRLGIAGLILFMLGFLSLLFGMGIIDAIIGAAFVAGTFYFHRICTGPSGFGRVRTAQLDTLKAFINEPAEHGGHDINQSLYEQLLPYASAWGLHQKWAQRFTHASAEIALAPQRPRWLATPRNTHVPEEIAKLIYDDLKAGLEFSASGKGRT
jgi:Predicted membrane protein (DUF2207)